MSRPGGTHSGALDADDALYRRLSANKFEGPEFELVADHLVRYAYPVLRSWIASGEIVARLRGIRSPALPALWDLREVNTEDAEELTWATLAEAAVNFKQAGMEGRGWSPTGGSSLRTYFVGGCLLAFGNVFRRWQRTERQWRNLVDAAATIPDGETADPADVISDAQTVQSMLRHTDERTRRTIGMLLCGYSHAEIAEELGTSIRGVEGQIYRFRRSFGKRRSIASQVRSAD